MTATERPWPDPPAAWRTLELINAAPERTTKIMIHPTTLEQEAAEHIRQLLDSGDDITDHLNPLAWCDVADAAKAWLKQFDATVDPKSRT